MSDEKQEILIINNMISRLPNELTYQAVIQTGWTSLNYNGISKKKRKNGMWRSNLFGWNCPSNNERVSWKKYQLKKKKKKKTMSLERSIIHVMAHHFKLFKREVLFLYRVCRKRKKEKRQLLNEEEICGIVDFFISRKI